MFGTERDIWHVSTLSLTFLKCFNSPVSLPLFSLFTLHFNTLTNVVVKPLWQCEVSSSCSVFLCVLISGQDFGNLCGKTMCVYFPLSRGHNHEIIFSFSELRRLLFYTRTQEAQCPEISQVQCSDRKCCDRSTAVILPQETGAAAVCLVYLFF